MAKQHAIAAALAAAACVTAHGAFLEYLVVRTVDGGLARHMLFGRFSGQNDTVLNAFQMTLVSGEATFLHRDALTGGVHSTTVGSWNPQFSFETNPFDSYVMIGGGIGAASGNTTAGDPDWGAAGLNQAQIPFGNFISGPGWYNSNPTNNQGRVGADGLIKLGQFVTAAAAGPALVSLKLGYSSGQGSGVQFVNDATFTIPAPSAIALLGFTGFIPRRRRA
ncbi:MAG: hypothetical protein ACKOYN_07400 [Planctomycetota bacterium]